MQVFTRRRKLIVVVVLLALAFAFRLAFGLCSDFWTDDERQVYLIGLKFYTTGVWPYFGPDVTNTIQIPGALQGLVVGLPLYVWPAPEAPFVLLNVLSFASLCFFAWYCSRRLPEIPRWIIWTWLLTAPWTLNFSTHIVNPSYVLTGGILFFVGLFETLPFLRRDIVPPKYANLLMGLGLCWVMQFHMSWVVLVMLALVSLLLQRRAAGARAVLPSLAWFALGAALTGSLLVPTYLKYGLLAGAGGTNAVVEFNARNLLKLLNPVEGILGRFLSFASFELPRFIGDNTRTRLLFLRENPWLAPFALFLGVVGILQPVALAALWFRRTHRERDWKAVKYFTLVLLGLLYVSFVFSFRAPHSHTFYVTLPVAMLYSLYCWDEFLRRRRWQRFALIFLACGVIFHAGLALNNFRHKSVYLNRQIPVAAIEEKNYHILGERREGSR